jgi:hypothetical protein
MASGLVGTSSCMRRHSSMSLMGGEPRQHTDHKRSEGKQQSPRALYISATLISVVLLVKPLSRVFKLFGTKIVAISHPPNVENADYLKFLSVFATAHFPFAFFAGFSPGSFDKMCSTVSIMPRIASGRVGGGFCSAIHASSACK